MKKFDVNRIIFSSSANVYGDSHASPISENARPLAPTNPYGRSKLMIENILSDVAASNSKLQVVLLRYFNPIGAHPSGLLGEQGRDTPTNIFPLLLRAASGRRSHFSVYGTDYRTRDGSCERDFIHVMDLADGHVAALLRLKEPGVFEINLGTGRATSVLQLAGCVERASNRKIKIEVEGRRKADLQSVYANPKRAKELMDWVATRTIDDACVDGWKWEQAIVDGRV
jgi:UDP-glucose 4-epimerase